MYRIERDVLRSGRQLLTLPRVSQTVLFLGLTSLFTDISSEMVNAILPLYLVFGLGLTPLAFGVVDGLYQGAAALVQVASGLVADRWRRHKEIATTGYALSAICRLGFLAVGNVWTALAAVVLLERTGKGIRTAPRDAMISLSTPRAELGTAFGVHRAMDTVGAMLGPLVAFGLLAVATGAYDAVFVVSFCIALVGVGIIGLFVNPRMNAVPDTGPAASIGAAVRLLRDPRFRALALSGAALGLTTIGDAFFYLKLQRHLNFNTGYFPLLYVGTSLVFMTLAMPIGQLADRVGRGRILLGGYVLLLLGYGTLALPSPGLVQVGLALLLLGAYYAATDGVLMALGSAVLPETLRGSGLAFLTTATTLARLFASVLFGALWTWRGPDAAVYVFAVGLAAAILLSFRAILRTADGGSDVRPAA